MGKRMLCEMAVMFTLGIAYLRYHNNWLLIGGFAVIAYLLLQSYTEKKIVMHGFLLVLCMCAGMLRMEVEIQNRPVTDSLDGQMVEAQGIIYKKEVKREQPIYYLNHVILYHHDKKITCRSAILYPLSDTYSIGMTIKLKGTLTSLQQARNEGNFDEKIYDQSEQIDFKIKNGEIKEYTKAENIGELKEHLYQLRCKINRYYQEILPEEEGGVLSTIALGEKTSLDTQVKKLYQLAGISHILAISGLHISVVGIALYKLLRRRGIGFTLSGVIAAGMVMLYGVFSGMSTSTKRAVGMFLCLMIAQALGEAYDSLTALAAMALVILFMNPEMIASAGFMMSFGAVIGVVTIAIPIQQYYLTIQRERQKRNYTLAKTESVIQSIKIKVIGSIMAGGGIWISTLPLVSWFYYEIPIYVIWLNLLLVPLLPVLLFAGLAGGILGVMDIFAASPWQWLAQVLLFVCHKILYLYELCADASLQLPMARVITGKPTIVNILIYYGFLYIVIYYMRKRNEKESIPAKMNKKKMITSTMKAGVSFFILGCLLFRPRQKEFGIDVLDVGQGDGTYICEGNGTNFFIDGGSSDVKNVGEYRILQFLKYKGVKKIDYWFVSHCDEDHISGLIEALTSGYEVEYLVFATAVVDGTNYQKLLQLSDERGVNIIYMKPKDYIATSEMTMTCIYPNAEFVTQDANAASLILLLQYHQFSGVFTGDTNQEQEQNLLDTNVLTDLLEKAEYKGGIEYFKVAHHGSKSSNNQQILQFLKPKYATISCGLDNSYGHPSTETVARLEEEKTMIFYTMKQGQIHIGFESPPTTMIE